MLLLKRPALIGVLLLAACHEDPAPVAVDVGAIQPAATEWPRYQGDGFEIRMPGVPALGPGQIAESPTAGMSIRAVSYVTPDKSTQYGVTLFDFPTVSGPIAFDSPLYLAVHGRVLKGLNAKILADSPGTFYSTGGHSIEAALPDAHVSGRLVVHNRRLYFLAITTRGGPSDALATRFLNSFAFTGP